MCHLYTELKSMFWYGTSQISFELKFKIGDAGIHPLNMSSWKFGWIFCQAVLEEMLINKEWRPRRTEDDG